MKSNIYIWALVMSNLLVVYGQHNPNIDSTNKSKDVFGHFIQVGIGRYIKNDIIENRYYFNPPTIISNLNISYNLRIWIFLMKISYDKQYKVFQGGYASMNTSKFEFGGGIIYPRNKKWFISTDYNVSLFNSMDFMRSISGRIGFEIAGIKGLFIGLEGKYVNNYFEMFVPVYTYLPNGEQVIDRMIRVYHNAYTTLMVLNVTYFLGH
ncbi:MAG: hypothetical protein KatS3mg027_0066 [Bacteroidia bacterium]|nr:MAG: hypothetical protein KatS3mg027_0066 [Bacteroidia bacterium]